MSTPQDTRPGDAPWGPVPASLSDETVRGRIRELRGRSGLLMAVLDDDPTGSQAVHGMDIVFDLQRDAYARALAASPSCFVLTNTRSRPPETAAAMNREIAADLRAVAADQHRPLLLVSRSDSTLRGHVMGEVEAIAEGAEVDAVLFAPAFVEAGRVTAGDVHWARVDGRFVPVGETEFARDATFGYDSSDLRDFVAEVSGGRWSADQVVSIGLDDIRLGGPDRVAEVIATARGGAFVVVNALDYADLECVALAALRCHASGQHLLVRSGPSMVRALGGQEPRPPLTPADLAADGTGGAGGAGGATGHTGRNGLVVVGSHVGQTGRQVAALEADGQVEFVVLDVPALLKQSEPERAAAVDAYAERVRAALPTSDVCLMTSRTLVRGQDGAQSLDIARTVSAALSDIVRASLDEPPAWVLAKGGITSHDIAVRGLGATRARVEGQLFPGIVSLFRLVEADARVIGRPYVVFPGNVGDDDALVEVVRRFGGIGRSGHGEGEQR